MKLFVSSVIQGMEAFRDAAAAGARILGHEVSRAEDFGASPASPQQACLAGVREADAVLLLLGDRYGRVQPSGLSATHEEYREARERCPVLVFVHEGVAREPDQARFLEEVQAWTSGHYTASFRTAEELRDAVVRAIRDLEVAQAAGRVDAEQLRAEAERLLPDPSSVREASVAVAVIGGPRQPVLRPSELEKDELLETVQRAALFGAVRVFDVGQGLRPEVAGGRLRLVQEDAEVMLREDGAIMVCLPAVRRDGHRVGGFNVIIEEDLEEAVKRALRFAAWLLDHVDPVRRLSDVVPLVALLRAGYHGWKTRAEQAAEPNTMVPGSGEERIVVALTPAERKRPVLAQQVQDLAEDFVTLLRRAVRR